MSTLNLTLTWVAQTCCYAECGVSFAMPATLDNSLRDSHREFYCPNGHRQHYLSETDAERERKLREQAERSLQWAREDRDRKAAERDRFERRLIAKKGAMTRLKNRVAHGVCPCCKRSFQDLARHMAGQHPAFVEKSRGTR